DITVRKRAEEALRASERRYQSLAKLAPVGIFYTDPEGRCLYVNERWCEITGLGPSEALGEGWARALHPDDRARIAELWDRSTRGEPPFRAEYRFRRPDGETTWVFGQAMAERDDAGHVTGYVGTVTDITDRERAEEALRRAKEFSERVISSSIEGILA